MFKDSRGRVRFTRHGVRYEINKEGVVRSYRRGTVHANSERAHVVTTHPLDTVGRFQLTQAIRIARSE